MSDGSKSDFLFYLTGTELLEFFETWPANVALAIHNGEERRFYLLPQQSLERDLRRLGEDLTVAVFPPVAGMASISITYAQENEVLHKLADRDDLLDEALRISERLATAEQLEALDAGREEDPEGETPAADQNERDILVIASLLSRFRPGERSEAHRVSLLRRGKTFQLRIGVALKPGDREEPLVGLLDGSGRRLALLTEQRAEALGLNDAAVQLTRRASHLVVDEYDLPSLPGLPARFPRARGSGRGLEREQELTLVGTASGALVIDLGLASPQPAGRRWGKRLMAAALAASWLLTLAAAGGYYRHVSIEPAQQADAVLPDFHSEAYVESLVNRLFPDDEPAES